MITKHIYIYTIRTNMSRFVSKKPKFYVSKFYGLKSKLSLYIYIQLPRPTSQNNIHSRTCKYVIPASLQKVVTGVADGPLMLIYLFLYMCVCGKQ